MCTLAYATSGCETDRGCLVSGSLMDDVEDVYFSRCLGHLPNITVDDVHRLVSDFSPAPQSKREKGFKYYISQYLHNFEGKSQQHPCYVLKLCYLVTVMLSLSLAVYIIKVEIMRQIVHFPEQFVLAIVLFVMFGGYVVDNHSYTCHTGSKGIGRWFVRYQVRLFSP